MVFSTAMSRTKIMIVDQSEEILEGVGRMLRAAGFDVITRSVAVGTSAAIARERPALVLLDAALPLLSGVDIAGSLRASTTRHGSVVALVSDRPADELDEAARRCGAVTVVPKSAGGNALVAEVRRILARRASAAPLEPRRGRLHEVLVAGRPETCAWARHLLRAHAVVRSTDSGTEALGRMMAKDPPDAVLLGTALLDLPAGAAWAHATRVDARWQRRIIVVEEAGHEGAAGPTEMQRWTPRQPEAVILSWLGLPTVA